MRVLVDTENSTYGIDIDEKRIMRVRGDGPETPRFEGGDWRPYESICSVFTGKPFPIPGEPLAINWEPCEGLRDNTVTSLVTNIILLPDKKD